MTQSPKQPKISLLTLLLLSYSYPLQKTHTITAKSDKQIHECNHNLMWKTAINPKQLFNNILSFTSHLAILHMKLSAFMTSVVYTIEQTC